VKRPRDHSLARVLVYLVLVIVLGTIAGTGGILFLEKTNKIVIEAANFPETARLSGSVGVRMGPGEYVVYGEFFGDDPVVTVLCDDSMVNMTVNPVNGKFQLELGYCWRGPIILYNVTVEPFQNEVGWIGVSKKWP